MRYFYWTNGPGKVWTRETIFVKKNEKNVGNFATAAVKLNFENIAKIK